MITPTLKLHCSSKLTLCFLLFLLPSPLSSFNPDLPLLLSFKSSILSDPFSVLADWGYFDQSPCSWNGVSCMDFPLFNPTYNLTTSSNVTSSSNNATFTNNNSSGLNASDMWAPTVSRVVSLVLPNSQLLGPVSPELGLIQHLRHLDLSGNFFNGTLPGTLFNASELRVLSLAYNEVSGEVPELLGRLSDLRVLNLAGNALTGSVPTSLKLLTNLTTVSLSNNYLHGGLPNGEFDSLQVLDLSSNLLNGTLPVNFRGENLRYLNLSNNRLTGLIPPQLGLTIPSNATVDLSFNNLTGPIPQTGTFITQKETAFMGNPDLCGRPLTIVCTIPSSVSNPPPNSSNTTANANPPESKPPPAFAAIPNNTTGDSTSEGGPGRSGKQGGLRVVTIIAIAAGDLAGIAVLSVVFMYAYHMKKKKQQEQEEKKESSNNKDVRPASPEASGGGGSLACCLRQKASNGEETEETTDSSGSSEIGGDTPKVYNAPQEVRNGTKYRSERKKQEEPVLVTVDGGPELVLETLLKASAYILGAAGPSIVYKAVLADGAALAVRRIGENGGGGGNLERLKDFEAHVRAIARIRHQNILRLRGFYWGPEEKLLIHDYAPNGSLSNVSFRKKPGSSPFNLNWDARLRIAKGIARGLAFLHEKKQIHGNIKPSNILLSTQFEPLIGDLGLDRLIKPATPARGSKRSALSLPDLSPPPGTSPFASGSTSAGASAPPAPYQAPESLKNLKPGTKWDVYSFGIILLELLAGRVFSEVELCQWNSNGFVAEEHEKVLRTVDPALRSEIQGREESILSCFKLGFSCCNMLPQKRPSMKEAVQVLDRIPYSYSSC